MVTQGHRYRTRRAGPVKPAGPKRQWPDRIGEHPFRALMEAHLEWLRVTGYSTETARTRRTFLKRFIAWAAEREISAPEALTPELLMRYQRHLFHSRKADGAPLSLPTQAQHLAALKGWCKWFVRMRYLPYNPASELELPKKPQRLPRSVLSVQEVEATLAEALPDTPEGLRDRALLELVYSTAIRRIEVTGLALYDVDLGRRLLMVREGKGGKDRVVPIGERALAWLERYLAEARPKLLRVDQPALFVSDFGEPVSPWLVATRVRRYLDFAGIGKPGATHLLRHACATHMLEGGADIRYIQAMLGHANLQTTEIYTHVSIEKLQAVHAASHPARLARVGGTGDEATATGEVVAADAPRR